MSYRKVNATVTRPADTTTYTAGDVVTSTVPNEINFVRVVGGTNGTGEIARAVLTSSANQTLKGDFELWLFNTELTSMPSDNAAFAPTDAELDNLITVIKFATGTALVANAGSGVAGSVVYFGQPAVGSGGIPIGTKKSSTALYGVLVVRNAYVPISEEKFTINLYVE